MQVADGRCQPKVAGAKRGWVLLHHMLKSRLDFPEPDILDDKRGFLPTMSAVNSNLQFPVKVRFRKLYTFDFGQLVRWETVAWR